MDDGSAAGGCCGLFCTGILQQFFNTRTWGANWTCLDKCCRCDACWDAGEFDPADRPGAANEGNAPTAKDGATIGQQPEQGATPSQGGEQDAPPPAYKAADPMTTAAKSTEASQREPNSTLGATASVAGAQTGNPAPSSS